MNKRELFFNKYGINSDYFDYFSIEKVTTIEDNIKNIKKEFFAPAEENIFAALSTPIRELKVVILGQDPYFQDGAATGLAFEVGNLYSFTEPFKQRSLQNIIRVIYKSYTNELKLFSQIREEISSNLFKIAPPNILFKSWKKQGVLLLNSYLTVAFLEGANTGITHKKYWESFSKELVSYISEKNENIAYFLWGTHARQYEKNIYKGSIYTSNHPAMAFGIKEKDFLFFQGFEKTKNLINWLGT